MLATLLFGGGIVSSGILEGRCYVLRSHVRGAWWFNLNSLPGGLGMLKYLFISLTNCLTATSSWRAVVN